MYLLSGIPINLKIDKTYGGYATYYEVAFQNFRNQTHHKGFTHEIL